MRGGTKSFLESQDVQICLYSLLYILTWLRSVFAVWLFYFLIYLHYSRRVVSFAAHCSGKAIVCHQKLLFLSMKFTSTQPLEPGRSIHWRESAGV
jgi:hypothetical protein